MGIHIGFHAAGVTTEDRQRSGRCRKWISGIIAATGLYLFFRNRIPDYLIDKTPFVYPSFYGPVILMFAENAAMFVFWVLAGMQIANLCWRRQKTIK